jgi:hypothetical protein
MGSIACAIISHASWQVFFLVETKQKTVCIELEHSMCNNSQLALTLACYSSVFASAACSFKNA